MVTSSSAAVGCTAIVASKSALVAPIFIGDAEHLRELARIVAEDVDAEHLVALAVDDDLHHRLLLAAPTAPPSSAGTRRHRCRRPHGACFASSSVSPTVPISGVVKTAVAIVEWSTTNLLRAEHAVGEGLPLADGDGGQVDPVGHIARRRRSTARSTLRGGVDADLALVAEIDPGLDKAEPLRVRRTARGVEHDVAGLSCARRPAWRAARRLVLSTLATVHSISKRTPAVFMASVRPSRMSASKPRRIPLPRTTTVTCEPSRANTEANSTPI